MTTDAVTEIAAGDRFAFGENWARFLELLDPERIAAAEDSLRSMLDLAPTHDLRGRSFLDIGSGSGLFSLAARNLGADVHSFDFDPESVACTAELRSRYRPGDLDWTIELGSALDADYLGKLGEFDIVYSWGVLHHTGAMWDALANVAPLVAPGGQLFISIYNDQGPATDAWFQVKRRYNRSGRVGRTAILGACWVHSGAAVLAGSAYRRAKRRPAKPVPRGMDRRRDVLDWVGGWPFETARPEDVFSFYRDQGFVLEQLTTAGGRMGCNQFVFTRP